MDKKLTLGLFTLLFITSGVQSLAISKIQANKAVENSTVAFNASMNQQAAVGLYNDTTTLDPSDPSNPTPQGFWTYWDMTLGGLRCAYMVGETLYLGGTITDYSGIAGGVSGSNGCGDARQALVGVSIDLDIEHPSINSKDKDFIVSGSSVSVLQFKLFLLGYLQIDQVTGKLNGATKTAVMELQKNRGLSATGTFDAKTQSAVDSVLSAVQSFSIATGGSVSFVSKNASQKAAVGAYDDTITLPDSPTPQGYIVYIGADGGIYCGYMQNGFMYIGGTPNGGPSSSGEFGTSTLNSSAGCVGAAPRSATVPIDLSITFPSIGSNNFVISGPSVPVMQFKLALLGYMSIDQISGKLDDTTKSAILAFQTNRGLPQVGTYGPKTQSALDSVLSGVKRFSVLTGGTFIFK